MSHLGGWLEKDDNTYMPEVWDDFLDKGIKSVVDIGCGSGANLQWFFDRDFICLGIDGDPESVKKTERRGIDVIKNDYTKGSAGIGFFDLALCTEFAEHIEQQYEHNWLQDLQKCKWVLFTHALPGQVGFHHVNCKPMDYWHNRFKELGFEIDHEFTNEHRSSKYAWGRNTLTLFEKLN